VETAGRPPQTLADWYAAQKPGALHHDDVLCLGAYDVRVRKIKRHKVMEVLISRSA